MGNFDAPFAEYMAIALQEAKSSLKEGNNGFGAVIVQEGRVLVSAHDTEETESDPTSHAELNAIRMASREIGRNLDGCILISTHEPCPMCATAVVWSGIKTVVYGYSITEALAQGRKRIPLSCREIFERARVDVEAREGVLHDECVLLYREDVRSEIKKLRNATGETLLELRNNLYCKRVEWFRKNKSNIEMNGDLVLNGYELLMEKLGIEPQDAPIVERTDKKVVFHSKNFCPTLEACKILNLDTRFICREVNEKPTDALVKQLSEKLEFGRNYEKLRPYSDYCEEMVFLKT